MIKITYYSAYTNMKNIYGIRYKLVRYALEYNVSAAAREFTTTLGKPYVNGVIDTLKME